MGRYIWFKKDRIDVPYKTIIQGGIQTGVDSDGFPILEEGTEVIFDGEPTPEQLTKLDLLLSGKREGGRNVPDVITDNLDITYPNPQKEAYKLSQLYGLTQAQLETYIDNNVTNLAEAKVFLKKLSAVVLWLVKQTKLDQ